MMMDERWKLTEHAYRRKTEAGLVSKTILKLVKIS